jgi:hypothetical protein
MEYSTKTSLPLNSIGIILSLPVSRRLSIFGIIFTHVLFAKGEKVVKQGLTFHSYPFLAIHAKGGGSISPKQKDRTTTNFKILVFIKREFCSVKGKAFETGGENFKCSKCFSKFLFIYL